MLLSMEILSEILLGHSGAPLQKALVDSGLGEDLTPVSGLDTYTMELVFSVGLRGFDPVKRDELEALVMDVFRKLVNDGIPRDIVTGALRRVEFRNREIKGGAPFGLRLMGKAVRVNRMKGRLQTGKRVVCEEVQNGGFWPFPICIFLMNFLIISHHTETCYFDDLNHLRLL